MLLYGLGSDGIEDTYLSSIIMLVGYMKNQHKRVLTASMFIYHGLIAAV